MLTPSAARDVADHRVSRYRLTTLRVSHEQSVRALDAHAFACATHLINDAFERAGLFLGSIARAFELRKQNLEHLQHVNVALPNARD